MSPVLCRMSPLVQLIQHNKTQIKFVSNLQADIGIIRTPKQPQQQPLAINDNY